MPLTHKYPVTIEHELRRLDEEGNGFRSRVDEKTRLLVAALNCLGFIVFNSLAGNTEKLHEWGPWVSVELPENSELGREYNMRFMAAIKKGPNVYVYNEPISELVSEAMSHKPSHVAAIRLLAFLEEFYRDRQVPLVTRLVLNSGGGGRTMIACQGDFLLKLYSAEEQKRWLDAAQAEMQTFAEFLCTKVEDINKVTH
jgi:hypothetical protein